MATRSERRDDGSDHPFWSFSLEVYARPGVAPACLALQDRYGLDVNLLLFGLWSAVVGRAPWRPPELRPLLTGADEWQTAVVRPLRAVRRRLKLGAAGVPDAIVQGLRRELAAVELGGERVEQLLIAALAGDRPSAPPDLPPPRVAIANLGAYLAVLGIRPDPEDLARLTTLVGAAFPEPEAAEVERLVRGLGV